MSAADVVRDAIEILQRDGWCQQSFGTDGTPRCLSSALRAHQPAVEDQVQARTEVVKVLQETYPEARVSQPSNWNDQHALGGTIIGFNDRVLQTQDEAIAVLEKAAIRLEERA